MSCCSKGITVIFTAKLISCLCSECCHSSQELTPADSPEKKLIFECLFLFFVRNLIRLQWPRGLKLLLEIKNASTPTNLTFEPFPSWRTPLASSQTP